MSGPETTLGPEEARAALATVRRVERQTRRAIGLRGGGAILMVWGTVWLIGFLGGHFLTGPAVGRLWAVADAAGIAATLFIAARLGNGNRGHRLTAGR